MQPASHKAPSVESELGEVRELLEKRSGVVFYGAREPLFRERVEQHLESRRLARVSELGRLLRGSASEYEALRDRLLAFEGCFLRVPELFEALSQRVLPEMHMKKFWDAPRSLRAWSAGCGAGEEPYSIALSIAEALDGSSWNVHVLAGDVNQQALAHAERGVYERSALSALSPGRLDAHFTRVGDLYMVKPALRRMVTFTNQNLAEISYSGRFDFIFCVDVVDYFRWERREQLLHRFSQCLEPGGFLFLGASEMPHATTLKLEPVRHGRAVVYQRPRVGAARRPAAFVGMA